METLASVPRTRRALASALPAVQATETADPLLADVYQSYVKLPYLGIGAGYRF